MRFTRVREHTDAFRDEVRSAVVGLGGGDTEVRDAEVALVEDLTGSPAWRVTLVLPRPRRATWDVDETLDIEDEVRRRTDEIATRRDLDVEGLTSVVVTTHDARPEDIAPEDEPEQAERSDATVDGLNG